MNRPVIRHTLLLLCFIGMVVVQAQVVEPSWSRAWPADTTPVSVGDTLVVEWVAPAQGSESISYGINDLVRLRNNPWDQDSTTPAQDVRITLHITATTNPDHGHYRQASDEDTLLVAVLKVGMRGADLHVPGLDSLLAMQDDSYHIYRNAHRMSMVVAGVDINAGEGWQAAGSMPAGLLLETDITWSHIPMLALQDAPDGLSATLLQCHPGNPPDASTELLLEWTTLPSVVAYAVEWTWVDDYRAAGNVPSGNRPKTQIRYDLDRDATRAMVPGIQNKYRVPLLYDRGYIIWRVRASALSPTDPTAWVHTPWAGAPPQGTVQEAEDADGGSVKAVPAHQPLKPWQASMSFAEDGKHKEVVTYADGSQRPRQVVTRNNTLGAPIVGERVYDAVGRPLAEVMPVPSMREGCTVIGGQPWAPIDYKPNFNQVEGIGGPAPLTWSDFAGDACLVAIPMLDSTSTGSWAYSGAAYYYSGSYAQETNPVLQVAPPFLPRAQGKPYSVTEHTRDRTGRVRAQGGTGPVFQVGEGHDTRYFYGSPMQTELDRLFGSEAGYADHYRKRVTIDPNAQATITYLDMTGRTVATALACEPPEGMDAVGGAVVGLVSDLFKGRPSTDSAAQQRIAGPALQLKAQFAVPCETNYTFDYHLDPLMLDSSCWATCAHCVYDLEISLKDDCGQDMFPPISRLVGSLNEDGTFTDACTPVPAEGNDQAPSAMLGPGEYTLTKTLRVHAAARDHYVTELLVPGNNSCIEDTADFVNRAMGAIGDGCNHDCDDCYSSIQSLDEFVGEGGTADQYAALLADCDERCKVPSWCDVTYKTMLLDMTKGGQYGKVVTTEQGGQLVYSAPDPTSIFRDAPGPSLLVFPFANNPSGEPWRDANTGLAGWRQPLMEKASGWVEGYYDDDAGTVRSRINLTLVGAVFSPPVTSTALVFTDPGGPGNYYTWPENLSNLSDFLMRWQDGWARSLVRFHPEYCYYRECKGYSELSDPADRRSSSDGFDGRLALANTWQQAVDDNLLIEGSPVQFDFATLDPFASLNAELADRFANYVIVDGQPYTMMQMAAALAHCGGQVAQSGCSGFGAPNLTTAQKDQEWNALRGLYQSEKYRLQKDLADARLADCGCPGLNQCIGADHWQDWWYVLHPPGTPWSAQPGNLGCQPCHWSWAGLFGNKAKRVPDPVQMAASANAQSAAYQSFLQTGQCPMATAWQALLHQVLADPDFEPGQYNLGELEGWQGVFTALNDQVPPTAVPQAIAEFTVDGNTLFMEITYADGTPPCTLELTFTGTEAFQWDLITFVAQLTAGQGPGEFSLGVYYKGGDGLLQSAVLVGTGMCHELAPCNFPPQCGPNELALQFQELFNLLASINEMDGGIDLWTADVPDAGNIQQLLGPALTSRFAPGMLLKWKYDNYDPLLPALLLLNEQAPGAPHYRLEGLELTDAVPPNLTLEQCLDQAAWFQGITGAYANRFTVEAYDANGNLLCRLKGKAWFVDDQGMRAPVSMGSCELPAPQACQDPRYQAARELADVLGDWLPMHQGQQDPASLWESSYMTASLAAALCPSCLPDCATCPPEWEQFMLEPHEDHFTLGPDRCLELHFDWAQGPASFTSLGVPKFIGPAEVGGAYHALHIPLLNGEDVVGAVTVDAPCLDLYECQHCPPNQDAGPGLPWPEEPDDPVSLHLLPDSMLMAMGLLHADTLIAGYRAYKHAVDSLNVRLGLAATDSGYVATESYAAYRHAGMQHAVGTYLRYIRNFRPEIDRSILLHKGGAFVADYGNTVNVDKEYQRYQAVVEDYNLRAAAESKPAMDLLPDSVFREMLYADKVADYIANLVEMPPLEAPPLGLADYFALSGDSVPGDPCALMYLNSYLPAYRVFEAANQDTSARCPDPKRYAPLVSLDEFRASNLCCSDSGQAVLAHYVQQLQSDSLKCPGALPRLKECPQPMQAVKVLPEPECQALYALWVQTMQVYHNSDYWVATHYDLDFNIPFQDFLKAGWCDCVVNYLQYIQVFIAWEETMPKPQPPMHIDDFCRKDCRKGFDEWWTQMDKYNTPCPYVDATGNNLPMGPLEEYAVFEQEGLCDCVEAYNVYIGMYLDWAPPMPLPVPPIDIEVFCDQEPTGPDCCVLTDSLKVVIGEYAKSPYFTEHGYPLTFEWKGCNEIEQKGLCDCLPAYLAYLQPYIEWLPEEGFPALPAPMELVEFCNSIGTEGPCADSYARYTEGMYLLSDLLVEVNLMFDQGIQLPWAQEELFTGTGLCHCTEGYLAHVQAILEQALANADFATLVPVLETESKDIISIIQFCAAPTACPPQPLLPPMPAIYFPAEPECLCCELVENAARVGAVVLYQQYLDTLVQDITALYNRTCMAALETLTVGFSSTEHHYTLYYYDQAGNLVRTVPPEGVEPMNTTEPDDLIGTAIAEDRANGTHTVFTNHRLASDHLYNSLGQPTRSAMPDQDKMPVWETALPSGLPEWLRITGSWFGAGGAGYLTGWRDMGSGLHRGHAYRTADGGKSWQRLHGLLGEDLTDVHFPSATVGFATGGHGSLVCTLDGGSSWDLLTDNGLLGEGHDLTATVFASDQAGVVLGNNYSSFTADQGATFSAGTTVAGSPAFTGAGHDGTDYQASVSAFEGYANGAVLSAPQGGPWTATGAFGSLGADLACMASFTAGGSTTVRAAGSLGVLLENNAPAAGDWRMLPTGTTDAFRAIAFFDALHGVALMDSATGPSTTVGVLRHTQDGGQSWTAIGLPGFDLAAMAEAERSATTLGLVAVGTGGTVVRVLLGANGVGIIPMGGVPTSLDLTAVWAGRQGDHLYAAAGTANGLVLATDQLGIGQQAVWTAATQPQGGLVRVTALAGRPVGTALFAVVLKTGGARAHVYWNFSDGTILQQQGAALAPATLLARVSATQVDAYSAADGSIRRVTLGGSLPFAEVAVSVSGTGPAQAPGGLHATPGGLWSAGPEGALFRAAHGGGGYTWADRSDRIRPLPLRAMDKGGQVAVGDQGLVYLHEGGTWRSLPTGHLATLRAVCVGSSTAAVAGDGGTAFTFQPAAPATLHDLHAPTGADLHAVALHGSTLLLGGTGGLALRTQQHTAPQPLFAEMPANGGTLRAALAVTGGFLAVGDGARVDRFVGSARLPVLDVYTPPLRAVDFTGGTEGYVTGDKLTARHTTDGGLHWRTVPLPAPVGVPDLVPLNAVKMLPGGGAWAVGDGGTNARFTGDQWAGGIPGLSPGSTDLTALAVAPSGAAVVTGSTGSTGSNGRYYRLDAGGTWTFATVANTPLYAAWNFPRIADKDEFIVGGQAGFARRLIFHGGAYSSQQPSNITNAGDIRAFWFHDHVAGFAATADGELYRTDPTTTADHAVFAWGTTMNMADGLDAQAQSGMRPATIGFSDRRQGFIGGSYNGTPERYARTLTDESGLYGQRFWYDALGRIVLSQNSKQFAASPQRFSYSLYDRLGRVHEAGELDDDAVDDAGRFRHVPGMNVHGVFKPDVIDPAALRTWVQQRNCREVTRTWYDAPPMGPSVPGFTQENLRLRVATTTFREATAPNPALTYDHATHYSYDIHGNVKHLVQDIPQLGQDGGSCSGCVNHRYKHVRYKYDLISGNVLQVAYQSGDDGMLHRYYYDADNRLTEVRTSADGQVWYTDAEYFYYPHGPLERVELGEHKVQGMDYAYTLQGWLKGINSDRLTPETDMGQDGLAGTANAFVGRDAFGESIGYYGDADYSAISPARWDNSSGNRPFAPVGGTGTLHGAYNPLYNGNIAHTVNSLQPFGGWVTPVQPAQVLAQVYRYDQLNRLKQAQGVAGLTGTNTWNGITDAVAERYKSQYTYDANGNIETAKRYDEAGTQYDALEYHYEKSGTDLLRNRLYHLNESINGGYGDIGMDGSAFHGDHDDVNTLNNYQYDELGNLIADKREQIANIEWTVAGKVKHITRTPGSSKPELWFTYGADGQRTSKTVGDPLNGGYREYYLRDAQGNVMAMYKYADNGASLKVTERPVYGSSRLGSYTRPMELVGEQAITTYPYMQPMQSSLKRYELTDHLGNVNTVVTGRLLPLLGPGVQYQAEVVSAQGYEAFGSLLPGRNYSSGSYRFGFNGKPKDDEIYGSTGASYDFGDRMYDARVGVWLTLDPKTSALASWSPYHYGLNNPILFLDPDGQFPYTFHVRSFAPPNAFKGSGFHDDNRGFSTSTDVTSRIKQNFTIDPSARTYSGGNPTSDPTYWNGINMGRATNKGGISPPEFSTNSVGSAMASISAAYEGSNPAFFGTAPNIAVSTSVSITENLKAGQVLVSLDISSKQFPATESFVQDAAGNSVFLVGAAAYGNALDLAKSDKTPAATIDLTIGISDKGIFQNVTMGGKTYSIDEFNKLGTSVPAGPYPREEAPGQ